MKLTPDPCKVCLCKEGWKGQTESKDFCYTIDCALGVKASSEMKRGCQPIYKEGVCCPIDWTCPIFDVPYPQLSLDTETESEQPQVSGGMIICPPGVAIRPGAAITANAPPPEEPLGVSEVTEDRPRPGVNFTKILGAAFLHKSVFQSFSLLTVWLCNFW
jgi:hypothetical protein